MPRLNRVTKTGSGFHFGKSLVADLDFKNGRYLVNGDPVAVTAALEADAELFMSFNAAHIVAGSGWTETGSGDGAAYKGALKTIFLSGCTILLDFIKADANLSFWFDSNESSSYAAYWGVTESNTSTPNLRVSEGDPQHNLSIPYRPQIGRNRVAATFDRRFLGCSMNGAPAGGFEPKVLPAPLVRGGFGVANSSIIERARFYKPVVNEHLLQSLSRI